MIESTYLKKYGWVGAGATLGVCLGSLSMIFFLS